MKYQYQSQPPSRRRQQGSFIFRAPAEAVHWWTICATEEVSSLYNIRDDKKEMECISSKSLWLRRPEPPEVPKEEQAKPEIIQVGVL